VILLLEVGIRTLVRKIWMDGKWADGWEISDYHDGLLSMIISLGWPWSTSDTLNEIHNITLRLGEAIEW